MPDRLSGLRRFGEARKEGTCGLGLDSFSSGMDEQLSLFSDLPPEQSLAHPPLPGFTDLAPSLTDELAAAWGLPIGRRVRVELRRHAVPGLLGLLQVAALPDLPLDGRRPLRLRIGHEEFTSQQIVACSLLD